MRTILTELAKQIPRASNSEGDGIPSPHAYQRLSTFCEIQFSPFKPWVSGISQAFLSPVASNLPRCFMPVTDQGKCITGMMKKLEGRQKSAISPLICIWLPYGPSFGCIDIPVRIIGNTSQSVVPGQESREKCEETASFDDRRIRHVHCVAVEVSDTEQHECHIQRKEQCEESNGRAEGAEYEDEGEDEPALYFRQREITIESEGVHAYD